MTNEVFQWFWNLFKSKRNYEIGQVPSDYTLLEFRQRPAIGEHREEEYLSLSS